MINRRQFIGGVALTAVAGLSANVPAWAESTSAASTMLARKIPSSGETMPVIGMGTSGSFEVGDSAGDREPLREVLRLFFEGGGKLIDTAPSYGPAESVLGDLLTENQWRERTFLATKIGTTGRAEGFAQFSESLKRLRTDRVELLQVHNLRDWKTQLEVARELKSEGKVRYVGLTHYVESAHEELAEALRQSKPDFVQINYSVNRRDAEKTIFPVARDLGIAVLANRNFDDGKLFATVRDKALPAWSNEVGAKTWAELFLRFALSDPAVTAVIPATGKPQRQSDNLNAGYHAPLDAKQRADLIALFN
jgi:aryl-alcohol dehydrogenase-like predicted oxidoreductase